MRFSTISHPTGKNVVDPVSQAPLTNSIHSDRKGEYSDKVGGVSALINPDPEVAIKQASLSLFSSVG